MTDRQWAALAVLSALAVITLALVLEGRPLREHRGRRRGRYLHTPDQAGEVVDVTDPPEPGPVVPVAVEVPAEPPPVGGSVAEARPAPDYPPATDVGEHLARIRQCESGGDYGAVSASGRYRGAYQFDLATWAGVGGTGDPAQASPAEQDYRARALYDLRGPGPWPTCGFR